MSPIHHIYGWIQRNPASAILLTAGISVLLTLAVAVRAENTRTIVTHGPCQTNPRGAECQALFAATIRAFTRETLSLLNRKLDRAEQRAERRGGDDGSPQDPRTGGDPGAAEAGGPVAGGPPAPGGGDGGGGDPGGEPGPAEPPAPPPADPPAPPPPGEPQPPAPPPAPPPTLGDQVGGLAGEAIDDVTAGGCAVTSALGVCIR